MPLEPIQNGNPTNGAGISHTPGAAPLNPPPTAPSPAPTSAPEQSPSFGQRPSDYAPQYAPEATPPPVPPTTPILESLKSKNFDTSAFQSDDDLLSTIERSMKDIQDLPRLRQLAQVGWQAQQDAQRKAAEQAPAPTPTAEAPPAPKPGSFEWTPPEYDESWSKMVRYDEKEGAYVPAASWINPDVAVKMNAWREWQANVAPRLLREFPQLAWQATEAQLGPKLEEFKQSMMAEFQQTIQQRQAEAELTQYIQQNTSHLFQTDEKGNVQFDQVTQQPLLQPYGQLVFSEMESVQKAGEKNEVAAFKAALERAELATLRARYAQDLAGSTKQPAAGSDTVTAAPPEAPAPTAHQRNQNRIAQFLNENRTQAASHTPSRSGTTANQNIPNAPPQNMREEPFLKSALAEARRQGHTIPDEL